ncbi:MAG TPA: glycosyltransferase family 4 protein [Bryobacteraceae bacterium]|jgi:glycosyltransferase involved in cell wall biosynthesis
MAPIAPLEELCVETDRAPGTAASVLIVGNFLSASGGNRGVCEDLAERLEGLGWRVVATSRRVGRYERAADILYTAWDRRREYVIAQIDLFSGPAFFWALALGWLLRRLGKPYILTLHGGNLPAFSRHWPRVTGWLLRRACAVTAPSGYLADALRTLRPDIEILPNAIDLAAYPFRWRKRAAPRLVWVRAFHEIYDPELAVRTLAILAPEFPDIRLLMAGPDKGDGSCERTQALARALGVAPRLEYAGRIPKNAVAAWIDRGDIFLNTSKIDNHPVTLLEAMACGACVVSTRPGGVAYLAEAGVDCLLAAVGDAEGLADAIRNLLRRPELAANLSRQARLHVESCDWPAVAARWHSLLAGVIEKYSNPKGIHV